MVGTVRGAATREQLLQAAEQVFNRRGYHDASVSEICRQAGLAHGTFYRYFANKEEIFLQLVARLERALTDAISAALERDISARERLIAGYRAFLDFIAGHTGLYQVFREAEFVRLEIPRRFYAAIAALAQEILEEGIREGGFRPLDPEVVAYALLGIAEFIAMRYVIWEPDALDEHILGSTTELILSGIDTGSAPHHVAVSELPAERAHTPVHTPEKIRGHEPQGGEATRRALLQAAERMFGQAGFHRTTISGITYVAGVAQGTFYLYFPSKVTIFTELVREINRQFRAEERAAIAGLSDRREIERVGFKKFFEFISRHREAYRIIREAEFVDEGIGRWYYQRLAQGYVRGLRRGMARGEIRELDPEALAYALLGIGHFVGLRWIVWEGRATVTEHVLHEMLEFIMHGVSA